MTVVQKQRLGLALACAVILPASALATGPKGLWMVTNGSESNGVPVDMDALIQGTSIKTYAQAPSSSFQSPVEWDSVNNEFKTVGAFAGGLGGVYSTDHTLLGYLANGSTSTPDDYLDGTLDTKDGFSYATDWSTNSVVRYGDGSFGSQPTTIWTSRDYVYSITYDSKLDTFFVGQRGVTSQQGFITEIDSSGNVLGSFATAGLGNVLALAYDATDDTMWYLDATANTAYQTDAAGDNLSSMGVALGDTYGYGWYGGEIEPAAVPGPSALLPFAVGGLSLLARRRNRK